MARQPIAGFIIRTIALVLPVLLVPVLAHAGTLCGTVRDGATGAPIAAAGVFLRHPAGDYTGLHAATGATGDFCIGAVPAGTYDVEVRRDDYLVAYLRGVVVDDDITGVDVRVDGTTLHAPFPNPSRAQVRLAFRLATAGPVRLAVFDARGRRVNGWESVLPPGEHSMTWKFVDREGRRVPPGAYFVQLTVGTAVQVRRLVRLPE